MGYRRVRASSTSKTDARSLRCLYEARPMPPRTRCLYLDASAAMRGQTPSHRCAGLGIQLYEVPGPLPRASSCRCFPRPRKSPRRAHVFLLFLLILLFQISSSSRGRLTLWKGRFFPCASITCLVWTTVRSNASLLHRQREQLKRLRRPCGQAPSCAKNVPRVVL